MSSEAKNVVRRIREMPGVSVAGSTAWYLDTSRSLLDHLPFALAILGLSVAVLLYLVTRSVVLPLKAIVMNALSLSAAFGVLVWVFQDGRFEGALRYTSQGALELTQPGLLVRTARRLYEGAPCVEPTGHGRIRWARQVSLDPDRRRATRTSRRSIRSCGAAASISSECGKAF